MADMPDRAPDMSWRQAALRWAGLSLTVALVLQASWWSTWWYHGDWMLSHTDNWIWIFDLYLPALILAIALSDNPPSLFPHISAVAAFFAVLLQTFLMIFALAAGITTTRSRSSPSALIAGEGPPCSRRIC